MSGAAAVRPYEAAPGVRGALPRLLDGLAEHERIGWDAHLDTHGELRMPRRDGREELIRRVEESGLRGRGGAGFPTGRKMRAVASAARRPAVVVNAVESEPLSEKDRTLATRAPHLLLDGAELAARALGADLLLIGVCERDRDAMRSLAAAIVERPRRRREPELDLRPVPSGYVSSQESALVAHLDGRAALPQFAPPLPFERGVRRRPTFLSNAETFAHIALIARHGPLWFRELGSAEEPGSLLVSLSGAVRRPGTYEIEPGTSLRELVAAADGLTAQPRAGLFGGYGGGWLPAAALGSVVLSEADLAARGATLGTGAIMLLGPESCPAAETARLLRWLADQSAGQCGPCVHGLAAISEDFEGILIGAVPDYHARLQRLAATVARRGACSHPDGALRLLASALDAFAGELEEHARHGLCEACRAPASLPFPEPVR